MGAPITRKEAEQLYNTYYAALYKLALYMTKSKSMAEDAVSETFLKAFEHYGQYNVALPVKPWLNKILINTVRQHIRKNKRWFLVEVVPDEPLTLDFIEQLFLKEQEQILWQLVNQLTPKRREVIVLHYFEHLTLPEAAKLLDIPLGTCKSRLNAALTDLRKIAPNSLELSGI